MTGFFSQIFRWLAQKTEVESSYSAGNRIREMRGYPPTILCELWRGKSERMRLSWAQAK